MKKTTRTVEEEKNRGAYFMIREYSRYNERDREQGKGDSRTVIRVFRNGVR